MSQLSVSLWLDRTGCLYGQPTNTEDYERIAALMRKNGADILPGQSLLFVDGDVEFALHALEVSEVSTFESTALVDDWTFRHLCGYQSD